MAETLRFGSTLALLPHSASSLLALMLYLGAICPLTDCQATTGTPGNPTIDILIAHGQELIVVQQGQPVTMVRGETYDLACHFQPQVSLSWQVSWKKTSTAVSQDFVNSTNSYVTGWLGTVFEDYQIHFQNFFSDDGGFYWCEARNPGGVVQQVSAMLRVAPEVKITDAPNGRTSAFIGDDLTLGCTAAGYPPPAVKWMRNNSDVSDSTTLNFRSLDHASNGTYTCVASNTAGTAMAHADLVVVERLKWKTAPEQRVIAVRNQPLTVKCKATGYPHPHIEWTKFDSMYRRLTALDGHKSITLQPSEIHEGDKYACMARSPYPCCPDENTQVPLLAPFTISVSATAPPTVETPSPDPLDDGDCQTSGLCSAAHSMHTARVITLSVVTTLCALVLIGCHL